jgi:hypothetical protein
LLYTKYPEQIDSNIEIPLASNEAIWYKCFNRLRESVISIETELGINPKGFFKSVKDRLDILEIKIKDLKGDQGIQGLQGPQGIQGEIGFTGQSSFTKLISSFTQPKVGNSVNINIKSSNWLAVNQIIYIVNGGYYQVNNINNNNITITNLGYIINADEGNVIDSNSTITSGGLQGPIGLLGKKGDKGDRGEQGIAGQSSYTILAKDFVQPFINSIVMVMVPSTAWMAVGQLLYIEGGGYYKVNDIPKLTIVNLINIDNIDNSKEGIIIKRGSKIVSGGLIIVQKCNCKAEG